ncbi:LysE family translocator [Sciscionella marina]|uniref:LysE family translocator n=1 Tax=Sciscionella marina TaxID=508770 RepID=UPI00037C4CDF|nr:LysE family translocator [Sciscionella marina]
MGVFLLAVLLGAMVPGPTTALVIRRSALRGTGSTVPMVTGMELGLVAWVIAAALGVTALLSASELAYTVLRVAGALFLIYLGIQAWLAARRIDGDAELGAGTSERATAWRAFGTGLVTNIANPKIAAFTFAFYPQFLPQGGDLLFATCLLALSQIFVDAAWSLGLAMFVGRARRFFQRAKIRKRLERMTGTVLIALGIGMAADKL